MTLQLRPTFSESWYRVQNLKPKLRAGAQISRQFYRGERWYVVRDPAGNQYHRLSDAAYKFVGLLDGHRTIGEAWELVGGQLADDAPTQPEVIQILSQLYSANLIETNISPDATVLLRRHKRMMMHKAKGRLMNIMFPRIPLWDPDWFLKLWSPVLRPMLSFIGLILWVAVIGLACFLLVPHWDELVKQGKDSINLYANPQNALWLYFAFGVIKFIHELGHGFMCRRFGGEVHELGIMFLVLFPAPYVDASSAWSFPNKWHRFLVGAGGMIFELFVAAICAFFWLATKDSGGVLPLFLYNIMLIASFSTVVFNANPLLRYDGYYMLSDILEIPNLQHRSREYSLSLIKRFLFRVKWSQPLPQGFWTKFWMVFYFLTSGTLPGDGGYFHHDHGAVSAPRADQVPGHDHGTGFAGDVLRRADLQELHLSDDRARASPQPHARLGVDRRVRRRRRRRALLHPLPAKRAGRGVPAARAAREHLPENARLHRIRRQARRRTRGEGRRAGRASQRRARRGDH